MEQQIYQQEQIGNNQMTQQQMMLCPVRVVYENQMLMQPDEQVQQNQTIYFNQQTQPPWLRPVQNQIIYVQHIPNNVVPMQHTMDQNQLYVQQNYMTYPQLMHQQILSHNPQEQITYQTQVPNVLQNNPNVVVQNIQPNSTIQNVDTRNAIPNYAIQPNTNASNTMSNHFIMANNAQIQSNIQTAPRNVSHTVTSENMTQIMSPSAASTVSKPMEVVQNQGVYKNIAPQPNQQYIMIRPHVPQMMNQIQNAQNIQNVQHIAQTFVPNIRPNMPVFTQNVTSAPQNVQQSVNLRPNIQGYLQTPIVPNIQVSKAHNDGATVSYTAVRNGQTYTYRALQPRPQHRNMPNLLPMNAQNEMLMQKQNVPNTNASYPNANTNVNATTVTTVSQIKTEQNDVTLNRKRKSESPDEIKKKRPSNSAVFGNITVTAKPQGNVSRNASTFSDIGVNTVPVPKVQNKPHKAKPNPNQPAANQTTMERIEHIIKKELNMAEKSSKQNNKMRTSNVACNTPAQNIENKTLVSQGPVFHMNPCNTQAPNIENKPLVSQGPMFHINPCNTPAPNIENKTLVTQGPMFHINPMAPTQNIKIKQEPIRKETEMVHQSDIGQVASIDNKMFISQGPVPYITPMSSVQIIIKQEHKARDIRNVQQTDSLESTIKSNEMKEEAKQVEKDKLVRNTVFTQARGRVFNDKTVLSNVSTEQNIKKLEQTSDASANVSSKQDEAVQSNIISKDTKANASIEKPCTETLEAKHENSSAISKTPDCGFQQTIKTDISINKEKHKTKYEISSKDTTNDVSKNIMKTDNSNLKLNDETIKTKNVKSSSIGKSTNGACKETVKTDINKVEEVNAEKLNKAGESATSEPNKPTSETNVSKKASNDSEPIAKDKIGYKHLSINDMKGKEIHIVDGSIVREDRNHILTHVLDGFVIQESSVPFAIRKPLIEKIIYTNSPIIAEEHMDEIFGSVKDDVPNVPKTAVGDDAAKENKNILEISNLNITEENSETEVVNENKSCESDDPFQRVKQTAVRSWTAEELVLHLSQFEWSETVSVLQEHEIDGESLFLATKQQLLTIGVNETHADVICEFVKC